MEIKLSSKSGLKMNRSTYRKERRGPTTGTMDRISRKVAGEGIRISVKAWKRETSTSTIIHSTRSLITSNPRVEITSASRLITKAMLKIQTSSDIITLEGSVKRPSLLTISRRMKTRWINNLSTCNQIIEIQKPTKGIRIRLTTQIRAPQRIGNSITIHNRKGSVPLITISTSKKRKKTFKF